MNRRDAIKSLAMLPLPAAAAVPTTPADQPILIAGVKETPWLRKKVRILCNGKEVTHCILADVKAGCCLRYRTDGSGNTIISNDRTELLRETIWGNVLIELLEV